MIAGARTAVDPISAARRLIVALDFPAPDEARALATRLETLPVTYKIGLELIYAGGLALAGDLVAKGRSVFLDAKQLAVESRFRNRRRALGLRNV